MRATRKANKKAANNLSLSQFNASVQHLMSVPTPARAQNPILLEKQLAEEKLKIKSGRGIGEEGESTTLSSLREDLQQAKAEVALGLEREQVLLLEMNELQRQRDRMKLSVEALDIEKAKEIEPQVKELRLQIAEIEEEKDKECVKGEAAKENLQEYVSKIKNLDDALKKIEDEKAAQEVALSRIESLPDKIKKQRSS